MEEADCYLTQKIHMTEYLHDNHRKKKPQTCKPPLLHFGETLKYIT